MVPPVLLKVLLLPALAVHRKHRNVTCASHSQRERCFPVATPESLLRCRAQQTMWACRINVALVLTLLASSTAGGDQLSTHHLPSSRNLLQTAGVQRVDKIGYVKARIACEAAQVVAWRALTACLSVTDAQDGLHHARRRAVSLRRTPSQGALANCRQPRESTAPVG